MIKNLSHIGIAVENLENSINIFKNLLNQSDYHTEKVESQKVNLAIFKLQNFNLELLEPTLDDSPIKKFLDNKGEGIHHISFEVEDIKSELERLKNNGFKLINEQPVMGAEGKLIAFVHPKSTNGVLIELSQKEK
ncbi:MAG: Methylmalonyl-CoA epimerase [Ignavibacteriae bacterium]|nr:MAG: Methylmalonyl-CoA epimerase [Ignavibacteriota bacterium]